MTYNGQVIDVRISRRVLWVGAHAYPLHAVAGVGKLVADPDHSGAVWGFIKQCLAVFAGGVVAAFLLSCLHAPSATFSLVGVLVVILLIVRIVQLVRRLSGKPLYALTVQTNAGVQRALVSYDRALIDDLQYRVVDAIDNPAAEFAIQVENIYGDKVFGDSVRGDKVMGDKHIRAY